MTRLYNLLLTIILTLTACAPAAPMTTPVATETTEATITVAGTAEVGTAEVITVEPVFGTALPSNSLTPVLEEPPTPTLIPTLPGGLGPTELKYRVLEQFPNFFFCDPDYYPIQQGDELELARQRFPELQANTETFNTILTHNNLAGLTTYTDDQKLLIYREYKKLAAVPFTLAATGYQFQIQVAETEGEGELVTGLIDGQGVITVQERTAGIAACPICLAAGTLISTPTGSVLVQTLRPGMLVWTMDRTGARVALPLVRVTKTSVSTGHQVVHLLLNDGRQLWLSPGHPTADGRTADQLPPGHSLDGAMVLSAELVPYAGAATYDLLPAGETGYYWANGILIASTLRPPS
jgi:hypothetical protein